MNITPPFALGSGCDGSTILMSNGAYFSFLEPGKSHFTIGTIAHALARICRFTGHTRTFYSVAQHSVMVSGIVPPKDQLAGLLHDAAEAFIGDVSSPLKQLLPDYKVLEKRVEAAVLSRFGLSAHLPQSVKDADLVMLVTELRDLLPEHDHSSWPMSATPLKETIQCWDSETAEREFLARYYELVAAA